MKRFAAFTFLFAALGVLAAVIIFVTRSDSPSAQATPALARRSIVEAAAGDAPEFETSSAEARPSANIPLSGAETLLDVLAFNLDADQEDEQVLVVKRDDEASIRIVVADYDPEAREWIRSWEGVSAATKIKTFQVIVSDLVGDRNLDLVCSGMDEEGEQTMTVFWRSVSAEEPSAYVPIASIRADSIIIEETDRPESYKLGQTNGESWKIAAYSRDEESDNLLDQVRETWAFSFRDGVYVSESVEKIPGAQIEQRTIARLLTGDADAFERFLDGIWYRETDSPNGPNARLVVFDPFADEIHFIADGLIESYGWEDSHPTRYGIFIGGRSMAVASMRRLMDVELTGSNRVGLRIFQDLRIKADISEQWNGRYRKMGPGDSEAFARGRALTLADEALLEGDWNGPDGATLAIAGDGFRRTSELGEERGGKALFTIGGKTILQMRSIRPDGLAGPVENYEARLRDAPPDGGGAATLELVPVRIGMDGAEPTGEGASAWTRAAP
ncbi:MAG: pallilysin-related adhesin [Spirochaetales bacterium]|nr:pallilysin-related adhesin [Spirochaetales bacterium]